MHFTFYDWITLLCFLISLASFLNRPTPVYLKLYPVYFFSALLVGMRMEWLAHLHQFNTGIGNIWIIIDYCFCFFVLHEIIDSKKVRRIIRFAMIIFAVFAFVNIGFVQKRVGVNPVNFTTGCLIIVILCIYYFVELFQKPKIPTLGRSTEFWIVSALLFNNVLLFPQLALDYFMETFTKENFEHYHIIFENLAIISNITTLLTAVLYSIGFLCKIRKSTL